MEDEDKNSKSLVLITRVGSTPTTGIKKKQPRNRKISGLLFLFWQHFLTHLISFGALPSKNTGALKTVS